MMTITIQGIGFRTVSEALQWYDASGFGDDVVSIRGQRDYYLVRKAEADRLDALGVVTAYWHDRDGILMSVPVGN